MDFAGNEIDASQQADRAMALVFMFTSEGGMDARFGGKSGAEEAHSVSTLFRFAKVICPTRPWYMRSTIERQAWPALRWTRSAKSALHPVEEDAELKLEQPSSTPNGPLDC
jgi:hypothetical protein